ncbi:MAG: aspartate aminotransferase family protein [Actinobacteria bacterium]|nr:aspartate aminotransferase family protein [Actinomycetota bacterium]
MASNNPHSSQHALPSVLGRYFDLELVSGSGCYLTDRHGNQYLDFSSGIGVTSTGHCHPKVVQAIQSQAETLIHPCIAIGTSAPPLELSQKIETICRDAFGPSQTYQSFFAQSGSEAVEAAIKLAKYVSKRSNIVAFSGGFHGRTYGALSLTTSKEKYREGYAPFLPNIDFFPYPYMYRRPWPGTSDEACLEAGIQALTHSPLLNEEVAAVIIEPILGEGGYVPAPAPFLIALAKRCRQLGILLIADEIQSGMGRAGTWFASSHAPIQPDMITLAKGLASGMPLSACVAKKSLMDQWPPGAHGGTYGANPVTCNAANATIDVLSGCLESVQALGKFAIEMLNTQLSTSPYVGDIRGHGLMIGIELVKDKGSKTPYPELAQQLMRACLEQGLVVISCGLFDNVIRLIPPLIIDQSTLEKGLSILVEAIHDSH